MSEELKTSEELAEEASEERGFDSRDRNFGC